MRGNTEEEKWCVCAGIPALKDTQYNMMLILRISKRMGLRGEKKLQKNMPTLFFPRTQRIVNARLMCHALYVSRFQVGLVGFEVEL